LFEDDLCSRQLILLLKEENKDTIVDFPPFMKVHMKGNLDIVGKICAILLAGYDSHKPVLKNFVLLYSISFLYKV
jgi:hypothetical protein